MHTRAQGSVSPIAASSPPSTRRRKRASNGVGSIHRDTNDDGLEEDGVGQGANGTIIVASVTTTPTKPPKRVRFSDPGPFLSQDDSSSSGLTPQIQRFSFTSPVPRSRVSPRGRMRRRSLPATLSQLSDTPAVVQELQFTPLKQLLGDRTRRRLRRNHLSETMNDFESQQKHEARIQRELSELSDLRKQAELRESKVKELSLELELQQQLGIEINEEEEETINILKHEIETLREELAKNSAQSESDNNMECGDFLILQDEALTKPTINAGVGLTNKTSRPSSDVTSDLADAKATLTTVIDSLISLGFPGNDASEIISNIQDTFRSTRLALEHLLPGETPTGLSSPATLLAHTLTHIRTLLSRLQTTQQSLNTTQTTERALRGQFNSTLARLTTLTASKDQLDADYHALRKRANAREARIADLTAECAASTASAHKLQTALESYRTEVANLERVVTTLDQGKQAAEAALQSQLAEKQAAIRALQEEVAQRADDAEAAIDRADELQRSLARAEREIQEGRTESEKSAKEVQRLVGGVLRIYEQAGKDAMALASDLCEGSEQDGGMAEVPKGITWSGVAKSRDSGVAFLDDVTEEL